MKILMVNKFLYPRGGSESYMLSLGAYLQHSGHEVEYFGMYDEKNTVGNEDGLYTQNMDFHSKGAARFLYPFKIIYSLEAKRKIARVLDRFQPDVVHMNNINFQLTPSIIDAVAARGIPLVQTVHDYQMICPNHLLYNFDKNTPCEKCLGGSYSHCLKNKCIHNSTLKSLLGIIEACFYRIRKTYRKVDLYICPSHFLENKLLSSRPLFQGKTYTIHNFINKQAFSKTGHETEPYIVYLGRLSKEKGITNLAGAARLLPEYRFVIVGSGPDEEELHGLDNVQMMGFMTGEPLVSLLANASLLLLPSVCYENCPLSILEAHALGVPVVTMNSGGMAELVRDGETGVLVNIPTPDGIARTLRQTLENKELCHALRENCRKEKDSILSVETYCERLLEKYQSLIEQR